MNRFLILCAVSLVWTGSSKAHQFWLNGEEVPAWVRSSCCGKADARHLNPSAVHITADGVHIDGINTIVPMERVLPSQDGSAWAFWNENLEPNPLIYCIFLPLNGT